MIFSFSRSRLPSIVLALAAGFAWAQGVPTPTPAPEKDKPKVGYIRLWNMLPADGGDVLLVQDTGGEGEVITAGSPANLSARYSEVKIGRFPLKVARGEDPKTALKVFDLLLRENVFVTILVQSKDKEISIEMLDDTYDPTVALTGKLTVRHFIPGAKVTVTVPGIAATRTMSESTVEVLDNLPLREFMLEMNATLADGRERRWTVPTDFSKVKHSTLLLALDPYGRFRPRISFDGQAALPVEP